MFWIDSKKFPLLTPIQIKEQIDVRLTGLKNKRGTGIPRTDILKKEITTLKELWRDIRGKC